MKGRSASASRRDRGFALLIVLWSLVLLSLIITQLLSAGRSETLLAANLRSAAMAEAVAQGAIEETLFHLVAGGAQNWPPRGTRELRIGQGVATVAIEDPSNKINPDTASPGLLRALLGQCGVPGAQSTELARALTAWRGDRDANENATASAYRAAGLSYVPLGLPLETVDEVRLIVGMTKPVSDCLIPHLSLFQIGTPTRRSDDPVVARAVAAAEQDGDRPNAAAAVNAGVVEVTATATVPGGRFVRRAVVRLGAPDDGRPYRILTWEAL